MSQASIALSEDAGFSPLLCPCFLYTARALSTACSPDWLNGNAPKTLSTLARARARLLRPCTALCATCSLFWRQGFQRYYPPAPSQKSRPWLSQRAAGWRLNIWLTVSERSRLRNARSGVYSCCTWGCFACRPSVTKVAAIDDSRSRMLRRWQG